MMVLLFLAALPFGIKAATMFFGATGYSLQSLYKIAQLLVPAGWRYAHGERGLSIVWPIREPRPSVRLLCAAVGVSVAFSGAAIIAVLLLAPVLGLDPTALRSGYDARFAVSGVGAVAVVLFLSFLNSALEELHFRVWLDRELSKRTSDRIGIAVSAIAFGSMHGLIFLGLPQIPPFLIAFAAACLILPAVAWSLMLRRPGGIYAAWISHGLTDAILLGWGLFWLGYL